MNMGGEITYNGFGPGQMAPTTSGNITIGSTDWWPYGQTGWIQPSISYYPYNVAPVECSGDVHVFPCPHCEKCKCGKATIKRDKRGRRDGR